MTTFLFQICYVDEQGNYTADAPEFLRFKSVLRDGTDLVLNHVVENVISSSKIDINYPMDWRTKQPVIIRTSKQWFINTDRIKETALQEVRQKIILVFIRQHFGVVHFAVGHFAVLYKSRHTHTQQRPGGKICVRLRLIESTQTNLD